MGLPPSVRRFTQAHLDRGLHPTDERAIEFERRTTLRLAEAAHILRVAIACVDRRRTGQLGDSLSGMRAAVAAGLESVRIATTLDPTALRGVGAGLVVKDFTDRVLPARLRALV